MLLKSIILDLCQFYSEFIDHCSPRFAIVREPQSHKPISFFPIHFNSRAKFTNRLHPVWFLSIQHGWPSPSMKPIGRPLLAGAGAGCQVCLHQLTYIICVSYRYRPLHRHHSNLVHCLARLVLNWPEVIPQGWWQQHQQHRAWLQWFAVFDPCSAPSVCQMSSSSSVSLLGVGVTRGKFTLACIRFPVDCCAGGK